MTRDDRQRFVAYLAREAFGEESAASLPERALRHLEESLELYQAAGGPKDLARALVDRVFSRAAGAIAQEVGGSALTLLALSEAAGLSADEAEAAEVNRVQAVGAAALAARNAEKVEAGFTLTSARHLVHVVGRDAPGTMRDPATGRTYKPSDFDAGPADARRRVRWVTAKEGGDTFAVSELYWYVWVSEAAEGSV